MEVLIVGAGIAGLSAAYQLEELGLDYTIVECSRIGGRIYTYPLETSRGTLNHDMGAEYFLSYDHHLISLIDELGLEKEEYLSQRAILDNESGNGLVLPQPTDNRYVKLRKIAQTLNYIGIRNIPSLFKLKNKVKQYLQEVEKYYNLLEYKQLWNMYGEIKQEYIQYISMTLEDYLASEGVRTDFVQKLVSPLFRAIYMLDGDHLNALFGVLGFAAKNAEIFRIKGGNASLIRSLLQKIPQERLLHGQVRSIKKDQGQYTVEALNDSDKIILNPEFVYFATPLSSLRSISFDNFDHKEKTKLNTLRSVDYNSKVYHHLIFGEPRKGILRLIEDGADTIFLAKTTDIVEINKVAMKDDSKGYFDITSAYNVDTTGFNDFFAETTIIHSIHWKNAYPLYTPKTLKNMPSSTMISERCIGGTDLFMTTMGHSVHTSNLVVQYISDLYRGIITHRKNQVKGF